MSTLKSNVTMPYDYKVKGYSIDGGGGDSPSGKITITENGNDIDIAAYATADVNVPTGGNLNLFPLRIINSSGTKLYATSYEVVGGDLASTLKEIGIGEIDYIYLAGEELTSRDVNSEITGTRVVLADIVTIATNDINVMLSISSANCNYRDFLSPLEWWRYPEHTQDGQTVYNPIVFSVAGVYTNMQNRNITFVNTPSVTISAAVSAA